MSPSLPSSDGEGKAALVLELNAGLFPKGLGKLGNKDGGAVILDGDKDPERCGLDTGGGNRRLFKALLLGKEWLLSVPC